MYSFKLCVCVGAAYKSQLEEKKRRTVELEKSTDVLEEQARKLEKQFAFNQENIER